MTNKGETEVAAFFFVFWCFIEWLIKLLLCLILLVVLCKYTVRYMSLFGICSLSLFDGRKKRRSLAGAAAARKDAGKEK